MVAYSIWNVLVPKGCPLKPNSQWVFCEIWQKNGNINWETTSTDSCNCLQTEGLISQEYLRAHDSSQIPPKQKQKLEPDVSKQNVWMEWLIICEMHNNIWLEGLLNYWHSKTWKTLGKWQCLFTWKHDSNLAFHQLIDHIIFVTISSELSVFITLSLESMSFIWESWEKTFWLMKEKR